MAKPHEGGDWTTIDDREPKFGDTLPPLTPGAKRVLAELIRDTGGDHEDRAELEQHRRTRPNR